VSEIESGIARVLDAIAAPTQAATYEGNLATAAHDYVPIIIDAYRALQAEKQRALNSVIEAMLIYPNVESKITQDEKDIEEARAERDQMASENANLKTACSAYAETVRLREEEVAALRQGRAGVGDSLEQPDPRQAVETNATPGTVTRLGAK
jgi:predicted  nucleic acid-binding Zn-ribbon protein